MTATSIKIRKRISTCFSSLSSTDVYMMVNLSLPFIPSEGLCIKTKVGVEASQQDSKWDWNYFELKGLTYNTQSNTFEVDAPADKTIYDECVETKHFNGFSDNVTVEKLVPIISEHLTCGWTVDDWGHYEASLKKRLKCLSK